MYGQWLPTGSDEEDRLAAREVEQNQSEANVRWKHVLICHECAVKCGLKEIYEQSILHSLARQGGSLCNFCGKDKGGADICVSV